MDNWSRGPKIAYKRWNNPELRDEANLQGRSDEDQGTDYDICTIASARADLARRTSASGSEFDKTEVTFTVDDALDAIGFGKFQWKMSALTGLSWIADAMEMMILSILSPQLHCEWRLPGYQVALITSVVFIGMGFGSPAWGNFSDTYGRKAGLTICMCWALFYGLLSAFAPLYGWLLVLRGLVGVGIGGAPQSVTLYSEFLPVKTRGTCVMLIAGFWAIGSVFEVLLALVVMPTLGWRWLLGFSTIPMAIFVCFCFWLPESVRYHVLTGQMEKAMATLRRIAKENGKAMPEGRITTYRQNNRGRIKDLFTPQYRRTTLLLWFIWFANAFSYYGIILLTTELFQAGHSCAVTQGAKTEPSCSLECKYLTSGDYKDLLWTTLAEFPGVLLIIVAIERIGRKKSLALCFFMFSLFILTLYACMNRVAVTICIFIGRAFISGGFQVAFVYTPEVYPTETRALAMGTSSAAARLGALITPFIAQVLLRKSVYGTLSLYCGFSLLGGVASLFLPIETLGRGLQESSLDQEAGETTTTTTASQPNGTSKSSDQTQINHGE
ncbi:synaptic vesicle 2-related protein [Centropristis striata]|uniref:synaptic vesicle 2-related protein n=1 Tax=Centropristis striata TaxID=184440 RepID=UPI0027E1957E|nr:synaptic vesicle 2-related protein [Centropristis striata]XP_059214396.1 synaptic vesicle 2-related protein [Centropristis striata]